MLQGFHNTRPLSPFSPQNAFQCNGFLGDSHCCGPPDGECQKPTIWPLNLPPFSDARTAPSWLLKEREVSVFDLRNPVRSTGIRRGLAEPVPHYTKQFPVRRRQEAPPAALHQSRPISCTCGTHRGFLWW
jgi:hypothetical protein